MTLCDIMVMLLLFVSVAHISTCHAVEVEYSKKIVSDRKHDGFGNSLATYHNKLVIGAPDDDNDRGSVIMDEGVRVKGPEGGELFGRYVDVNQQFMVAGSLKPYLYVYVYQSYSPYNMVAKIHTDSYEWGYVTTLVISDDNTIAVTHWSYHSHSYNYYLTIYQYDGSSTWHVAKKFRLENRGESLAVHGDVIVVGVPNACDEQGLVRIFNRVDGEWARGQTIEQDGVVHFGNSVAIYGQHMAVSKVVGLVMCSPTCWINILALGSVMEIILYQVNFLHSFRFKITSWLQPCPMWSITQICAAWFIS